MLHVTEACAEWYDDSGAPPARYAQAPVLGSTPADLASAALEARRLAGGEARTCVLTLGGKLAEQRVLALPEMARGALEGVLPRKAANLLEIEQADVLYAASPLELESTEFAGPAPERRWFVLAARRSLVEGLASALRNERVEAKSWACATLARLDFAQALCADRNAACIVIDVDLADVVVSLVHGACLRMQNRIRGSFESAPTLALSLIQEIRSVDAFWRKLSRGVGVQQVVVLGIDVERSRLFGGAVAAAIPGASVVVRPDENSASQEPEERARASRLTSLAACRSKGVFALSVRLPAPPKRATLIATAGCALLLAGVTGAVLRDRMSRELHELVRERLALEAQSVGLEHVRQENRLVEALLESATLETARLAALRETGVPVASVLEAGFGVVDAHADLMSLAATRFAGEGELRFVAHAPQTAIDSVRSLKAIQRGLDASPWLSGAAIEPPTVRSGPSADGSTPFEGRAQWETPR